MVMGVPNAGVDSDKDGYDVFIAFKHLDHAGQVTPDSQLAHEIYQYLTQHNLRVFFSNASLEQGGIAAYKAAIDEALDAADVLVAIGTSRENLSARWVRYEWDGFFSDILSGVKPHGRVFVYIDRLKPSELPRALRQTQTIQHGPGSMDQLYRYIVNARMTPRAPAQAVIEKPAVGASSHPDKPESVQRARLDDGREIEYIRQPNPASGAMKDVYPTSDGTWAVKLYRITDPSRLQRLRVLIKSFNPTLATREGGCGGSERSAAYFRIRLSWPEAIVVEPAIGVLVRNIPDRFRFVAEPLAGREKIARWYQSQKAWTQLPTEEKGDLRAHVQVCISVARSLRKLHQVGLVYTDLSPRNVLIDISAGASLLLDIEEAIAGQAAPEVLGTTGYIAPEIVATEMLPTGDPRKNLPCKHADEHALAVFLYEILFRRHPLRGMKIHSVSPEEDERLLTGIRALFVEHPTDPSNALPDIRVPYRALGDDLAVLWEKAFIHGLHAPQNRPSALDWETGLVRLEASLYPCRNPACGEKWFRLGENDGRVQCPFCAITLTERVPYFEILRRRPNGIDTKLYRMPLYDGCEIFDWHLIEIYPGEDADRTRRGVVTRDDDGWMLRMEGVEVFELLKSSSESARYPLRLLDEAVYMFICEQVRVGVTFRAAPSFDPDY
jgi:hypothetical protein